MTKRVILLAFLCIVAMATKVMADDYETLRTGKIQNPMLWADVPDPDIIRVGDTFYLVSTTMHLMPGAPIMRSKDLKNCVKKQAFSFLDITVMCHNPKNKSCSGIPAAYYKSHRNLWNH